MEILLTLGYSSFFIFLIGKMNFFKMDSISIRMIQAGFIIKVIAGIMVGLVYTFYYTDRLTADTFKFFDDSAVIFNSLSSHPGDFIRMLTGIGADAAELNPYYNRMNNWYDIFSPFNDNRTMIRFNTLVRFFSLGYYYVHVVFICFFSLMGIIATVKVFQYEFPKLTTEIFMILLLLPSVLFWGSGLLKDALVYFSFGMVLLSYNLLLHKNNFAIKNIIAFLVAMLLLLFTKFHVFVLVIPLLVAWGIVVKFRIHPLMAFSSACLVYFGILFIPSIEIFSGFRLTSLLAEKQDAFFQLAEIAKAGSAISIPVIKPEPINILLNAPQGFFTALTRPFITDWGPILTNISSIENTLILIFGAYSLIRFNKKSVSGKILPWFCLFYTLTYFTLIGLITPILGAIVRYKAQALPFLVIMFVIISAKDENGFLKKILIKLKLN